MSSSNAPQPPDQPTMEVLTRPSLLQRQWLLHALREETVGGILLLIAAVSALIIANSPLGDYYAELAATGADTVTASWLAGIAAALVALGAAVVLTARRRARR